MSWRARELKDRLLHSGGDKLIRSVKQAGSKVGARARGGGARTRARPGADGLHFKSLHEPTGELEAVLDDLEATSDPIFSTPPVSNNVVKQQASDSTTTTTSSSRQPPPRPTSGPTKLNAASSLSQPHKTDDPLSSWTASDEEDPSTTSTTTGTAPTDSEESEELELDEAVVEEEVLESLRQMVGKKSGPVDLLDSEFPPVSDGGEEEDREEGEGREGGEGDTLRRKEEGNSRQAINNVSANNNTHFLEVKNDTGFSITTSDVPVQDTGPTLEELLDHGSAALPSHSSYSSSSHKKCPSSSPCTIDTESSPSPLTSSNEADPDYQRQIGRGTRQPTAKHIGFKSQQQHNPQSAVTVASTKQADYDDLFPDDSTKLSEGRSGGDQPAAHSQEEGRSKANTKRKPLSTLTDELFPDDDDGAMLTQEVPDRITATEEDDLFPDDVKLVSSTSVRPEKNDFRDETDSNTLNIQEDHFSPSPEEQRKNVPPPSSRSQVVHHGVSKLSSAGRTAPPRPPRSPQLDSRLKLRQQRQKQQITRPSPPPSSSRNLLSSQHSSKSTRHSPEVQVARTDSLSPSPPSISTTLSNNREFSRQTPPETKPINDLQMDKVQSNDSLGSQSNTDYSPSQAADRLDSTSQVTDKQRTDSVSELEIDSVELPFLPLHVHFSLALLLYFYYTLNPFVYLAGLMAGFLLFYLSLGAVFVAYVQREEEETLRSAGPANNELSLDFIASSTDLRLEDYENRFTAPSKQHKFDFTATLSYDFATHHRRDRLRCRLKLSDDFNLKIHIYSSEGDTALKRSFNLFVEKARITVVPDDVFQNRKRRWSKKYPIRIEVGGCEFFLFSNVSRFKQEWFFRLREAAKGTPTTELFKKQHQFFKYMKQYFSSGSSGGALWRGSTSSVPPTSSSTMTSSATSMTSSTMRSSKKEHSQRRHHQKAEEGVLVQFSSVSGSTDKEEDIGSVSISSSGHHHGRPSLTSINSTISTTSSSSSTAAAADHPHRHLSARSLSSNSGVGPVFSPTPPQSVKGPPSFSESYWINALSARLYWDVWHEERWKKWIVSRIERKLVRIKTPRFLDPLQLTDIAIGESMPVIKRLHEGPYLRVDGVWVFLDVEYEGEFVMTIKTRLKLGRLGKKGDEEEGEGTELKTVKHHTRLGHSQAAVMLQEGSTTGLDPDDDSETGSEEEEEEEEDERSNSFPNPLEEVVEEAEEEEKETAKSSGAGTAEVQSGRKKRQRGAKLKKVVTNFTKKVASNRLVQRAAKKAAERARNVPLELTVEVRKLRGIVAVNIPPPSTDTIWYGFQSTPKLDLIARPKLGKRAVTFSQITHWIERKLCSIVDEKLTLPNMEDLVLPVLNSGLPEDTQKTLS